MLVYGVTSCAAVCFRNAQLCSLFFLVPGLLPCSVDSLPDTQALGSLSAQNSTTSGWLFDLCRWKRDSPPGLPTMTRSCYKAGKLFWDIRVTFGLKDSTSAM